MDRKNPMTQQAERSWTELSGRLENNRHILPIRVYFEDTDFSGFVYHTSYLRWCERGRSDLLRLIGVNHADLHAPTDGGASKAFVVRRLDAEYLRPAKIDDVLEVVTEVQEAGGAHLTLAQQVIRGPTVLCSVTVKVVLINLDGKPQRLPKAISARLIN